MATTHVAAVADIARVAVTSMTRVAPAVHDYIEPCRPTTVSDPIDPPREDAEAKAWFYLDHRHHVETGRRCAEEGANSWTLSALHLA